MTRKEEKAELIYKDESYAILGACFTVYRDKGCGFLEPVYHECLEIELEFQRIPFLSKPPRTLEYRGRTLVQTFSPDFICYDKIIVEIKARNLDIVFCSRLADAGPRLATAAVAHGIRPRCFLGVLRESNSMSALTMMRTSS